MKPTVHVPKEQGSGIVISHHVIFSQEAGPYRASSPTPSSQKAIL